MAVKVNLRSEIGRSGLIVRVGGQLRGIRTPHKENQEIRFSLWFMGFLVVNHKPFFLVVKYKARPA